MTETTQHRISEHYFGSELPTAALPAPVKEIVDRLAGMATRADRIAGDARRGLAAVMGDVGVSEAIVRLQSVRNYEAESVLAAAVADAIAADPETAPTLTCTRVLCDLQKAVGDVTWAAMLLSAPRVIEATL